MRAEYKFDFTGLRQFTEALGATRTKRYSRPCLPLLWPRLYAEPFGL